MKRVTVTVAVAAILVGAPAFAQDTFTLDTFKDSFDTFSREFAKSIPMNSAIGLNWSDAYIGQLLGVTPHFGVGITTGVTTIPASVFTDLADDLGVEPSGAVEDLPLGVLLPGYAFDARVGGFVLPFDMGVKIGVFRNMKLGDVRTSYTNAGFDIRYAVLDGGILPDLSVGVGYNYLSGSVCTPLGLGTTRITSVSADTDGDGTAETYTLVASDPDIEFGWQAHVFDFKAQISKNFLILEPHFGVGAAIGSASTQTGLSMDLSVDGGGATVDQIGSVAGIDIEDDGLTLESDVNTVAFRVFGGASLNLAVFRLDFGLMYNVSSGSLGGTLGARIQL